MNIGLLQTHAVGDIIISIPIAQFFIKRGHQVYWPVDERYVPMLREATNDEINFIPISSNDTGFLSLEYFLSVPLKKLNEIGCEQIFPLYSAMGEHSRAFVNPLYAGSLKFDEYKYAISGVPFNEKWNLNIVRNKAREQRLLDLLNINEKFVLIHEHSGDGKLEKINVPDEILDGARVIRVEMLTESIFDWLAAYELALGLFFVDSAHANLAEQMNKGVNKHLKLRSSTQFTPVFKNGWTFL